jgi:hypothetical protein
MPQEHPTKQNIIDRSNKVLKNEETIIGDTVLLCNRSLLFEIITMIIRHIVQRNAKLARIIDHPAAGGSGGDDNNY